MIQELIGADRLTVKPKKQCNPMSRNRQYSGTFNDCKIERSVQTMATSDFSIDKFWEAQQRDQYHHQLIHFEEQISFTSVCFLLLPCHLLFVHINIKSTDDSNNT